MTFRRWTRSRPRQDLEASLGAITVLSGLLAAVGIAGIVIPVLPGLILVWAGIALWCAARHDAIGWVVLAIVTLLLVGGSIVKFLLPGRRLAEAGVPWTTVGLGVLLGVVGFFVVPVVGVFLGFVLGVYLAERQRLTTHAAAWPSTRTALAAVGWSIVIELATASLMTATWITGIVAS